MYLVEELRKINPDLFILAEYRAVGGPDNGTIYPNVPYKECWNRNTGFGNVLDVIKEQSPDVVHWSHEFGLFCLNQNTTIQYLALLEAINKLGIKQTIVYHSVPQIPNAFFQHYFDKSSPFFDKIVAHTNEQMSFLMSYKVPQDKLIHINHGTKLSQLYDKQEARTKLSLPQDKQIVLSMGFFGGLKGVDELIDIHADLIKSNPNIMFIFAGGLHFATANYGKDYMKKCFTSILSKGLKDKFIITGFVHEDQLPFYYAASDLAVLNYKPSGYLSASGCSAKLVGSKRLILTTDATHRNDEIRNGVECLKAHYADMDGLKNLVKNQINAPNESIISNAYVYATENSWSNIANRYMKEVWT